MRFSVKTLEDKTISLTSSSQVHSSRMEAVRLSIAAQAPS